MILNFVIYFWQGLFGTIQYGVHINGFVRHPKKGLSMWIGKRSSTKQTWPGKLDQMVRGSKSVISNTVSVFWKKKQLQKFDNSLLYLFIKAAGGLSSGEVIVECAKRECQEEASVPDELLKNIKSAGCVR